MAGLNENSLDVEDMATATGEIVEESVVAGHGENSLENLYMDGLNEKSLDVERITSKLEELEASIEKFATEDAEIKAQHKEDLELLLAYRNDFMMVKSLPMIQDDYVSMINELLKLKLSNLKVDKSMDKWWVLIVAAATSVGVASLIHAARK